ncbi:MAG TPA: enoyl-CoA hydratase/isomerase family protein [Dehalococcoidia bacterium]|nr:enoyl-CoA hydratase/isomerase family protein [Dehalococcoidia bacterium]
MAKSSEALRLDIDGRVAWLTLCRPQSANRVDERLLFELASACEAISGNEDAALVVLRADGQSFCAGWDETTRRSMMHDPARKGDPFGCLAALPMPVLASMQGEVTGAGLELALACDVRVAATNARFSLPDVGLGGMPLAGGGARLPRVVGRSVATAMLLLGDELDAESAYRAGLVSRVFEEDALVREIEAMVSRIVANGPLALRYAKELVRNGMEQSLDQALRYELDLSVILQTTADRAEGVSAFLEKRDPRFEGR